MRRAELQGQPPELSRNNYIETFAAAAEALITRLKRFGLEPVNVAYHYPEGRSALIHPHKAFPTHTIATKLSAGCTVTMGFELPKGHGKIGSVELSVSPSNELLISYDSEIDVLIGRAHT